MIIMIHTSIGLLGANDQDKTHRSLENDWIFECLFTNKDRQGCLLWYCLKNKEIL